MASFEKYFYENRRNLIVENFYEAAIETEKYREKEARATLQMQKYVKADKIKQVH